MDKIGIRELELQCIVGIRPHEREVEQRVVLDLELSVDTRRAGRSGRIALTVDYDTVATAIAAMLRFRRYRLIESAAEELCAMLLATHPQLVHIMLKMEKPGALAGRARGAFVQVSRKPSDFPELMNEDSTQPLNIFSTEDAVLSMVRVAPGSTWQSASDPTARCLDWLVTGRLTGEGREWQPGELSCADGPGMPHWANPEPTEALVFRCLVSAPQ